MQAWAADESYNPHTALAGAIAKPLCLSHALIADPNDGVFTPETWAALAQRFRELGKRGPDPAKTIKLFPRPGVPASAETVAKHQ